jgi:hypothetical protein
MGPCERRTLLNPTTVALDFTCLHGFLEAVKMETAVFKEGKRKCRELPRSHGLGHGLVNVLHNYDTIPYKVKVCSEVLSIQDQDWSGHYVILNTA